jgi:hypothetical protein
MGYLLTNPTVQVHGHPPLRPAEQVAPGGHARVRRGSGEARGAYIPTKRYIGCEGQEEAGLAVLTLFLGLGMHHRIAYVYRFPGIS